MNIDDCVRGNEGTFDDATVAALTKVDGTVVTSRARHER